jgi:hypothetical protein
LNPPAAGGVKITLKVNCCPGVRVKGGFSPLMLNPVPLVYAEDMVTFEPPVLVNVSISV